MYETVVAYARLIFDTAPRSRHTVQRHKGLPGACYLRLELSLKLYRNPHGLELGKLWANPHTTWKFRPVSSFLIYDTGVSLICDTAQRFFARSPDSYLIAKSMLSSWCRAMIIEAIIE